MDNFDFKKYLAEGRIHQDLTENLGIELPKVTSQKANAKITNARTFAEFILDTWNTIATEENESVSGLQDLKIAKEKLEKVAKMKDEDEPVAENARTDAEEEGYKDGFDDAKNTDVKEYVETSGDPVGDDLKRLAAFVKKGGSKAKDALKKFMDSIEIGSMQSAMTSESLEEYVETSKDPVGDDLKKLAAFVKKGGNKAKDALKKFMDSIEVGSMQSAMATESLEEDARTDAEQEGYKDGFNDAKDDVKDALSKMKVSELKAKIRETILAELSLSEAEEEVDVNIDTTDKVDVEAGADDIEIEKPGVKTTVNVGLSPEEEIVQDSLKAAMDAANELGNQKLADQIGNTITFFTREFVVGQNTD